MGDRCAAEQDGPGTVLVVDDDPDALHATLRVVESLGYRTESAADGLEALGKLLLDVDIVLLDVILPGFDGYEVARRIRSTADWGDVPILMMTGLDTPGERALAARVDAFLPKPLDRRDLAILLSSMLRVKRAHDQLRHEKARLEEVVTRRTASLRIALDTSTRASRQAYQAHLDTIRRLAIAAEYRDEDTALHITRIAKYVALVAQALGLAPKEVELLELASPMHDVGKIGIPDRILMKPGPLTEDEWIIMRQHPMIGARILKDSPSELLQAGEIIALTHHERWDGSGYPNGYAGTEIHLWGRLCAVADVFDALTTRRPYKKAFPVEEALSMMQELRGTQFDPEVLDAFLGRREAVLEVQARYQEHPNVVSMRTASAG